VSRIGKMPVPIPPGVEVTISQGNEVVVKGPKGEMKRSFDPGLEIKVEDGQVLVRRPNDSKMYRALHGLTRALIANMVTGVSQGFKKELEIVGVGYRAEMQGANLVLHVGYSHPVVVEPRPGITFSVGKSTRDVTVEGIDKEMVGQTAAEIRKVRPPEPYKGKGIRYKGEVIRMKAGKAGKK